MDPLTESLAALNVALRIAEKVWDVTPHDLQVQGAADWARFTHNIGDFFITVQQKLIAGVK